MHRSAGNRRNTHYEETFAVLTEKAKQTIKKTRAEILRGLGLP